MSRECTCGVFEGDGIIITGTGNETNPHIVEVGPTSTKMVGVPSSYVDVVVTGAGTAPSPYLIKMNKSLLSPPAAPIAVRTFLAAGTANIVKPTGCTLVEIVLIGGGAGGQGGGGDQAGGRGGSGGGRLATTIPVSSAQFDCTVQVGSGGTGGTGGTGGVGSGSAGGDTTLTLADPAGTFSLKATGAQPVQGAGLGSPGLGSLHGQPITSSKYVPPVGDLQAGAGGWGATSNILTGGPSRAPRGGGKHAQFLTGRVNLIKNPNFDYGLTGWQNRTNASLVWRTSDGASSPGPGIECLEVTVVANGFSEIEQIETGQNAIRIIPGQPLTLQAKFWTANAGRQWRLGLGYFSAAGVAIGTFGVSGSMAQNSWTMPTWTHGNVPADAAYARALIGVDLGLAGETWRLDHVFLEQGAVSPLDYFDGDFPNSGTITYDWAGANAGGSPSTAYSEDVSKTLAARGGGIGGDGGNLNGPGYNGNGPGAGGGGGGGSTSPGVAGGTGGRGGDGAAWIIFY